MYECMTTSVELVQYYVSMYDFTYNTKVDCNWVMVVVVVVLDLTLGGRGFESQFLLFA